MDFETFWKIFPRNILKAILTRIIEDFYEMFLIFRDFMTILGISWELFGKLWQDFGIFICKWTSWFLEYCKYCTPSLDDNERRSQISKLGSSPSFKSRSEGSKSPRKYCFWFRSFSDAISWKSELFWVQFNIFNANKFMHSNISQTVWRMAEKYSVSLINTTPCSNFQMELLKIFFRKPVSLIN
jgi:hypothetical protein